jgi:DNA-binding MarR family transcriptional regulator
MKEMKKMFSHEKKCENYDKMFNDVLLNVKSLPIETKLIASILRTEKLISNKFDSIAKKAELTSAQFHILLMLYLSDNRLTQQQISNKLLLSKANVSSLINRMEKLNLLKRQEDLENKKINKILITEYGKKKTEEFFPANYENNKKLFSVLTKKEQQTMIDNLRKIRESLL